MENLQRSPNIFLQYMTILIYDDKIDDEIILIIYLLHSDVNLNIIIL